LHRQTQQHAAVGQCGELHINMYVCTHHCAYTEVPVKRFYIALPLNAVYAAAQSVYTEVPVSTLLTSIDSLIRDPHPQFLSRFSACVDMHSCASSLTLHPLVCVQGNTAALEMALGEPIGGGVFVSNVVFGAIILLSSTKQVGGQQQCGDVLGDGSASVTRMHPHRSLLYCRS
jgi:hypothetical protein